MSEITGIFVSLTTGTGQWSGTDDHIYVGICGTVGGREFALNVEDFDDFEERTTVGYSIGSGADPFGGREPETAERQFEKMTICLPNVTHVYLRKQGDRTHSGDDYWDLESCHAFLTSDDMTRTYASTGSARIGNEYGHKIWLAETAHYGSYRDARIPIDGTAECERD